MKEKLSAILTAIIMSFATINYAWSTEPIELIVPIDKSMSIINSETPVAKSFIKKITRLFKRV
jgi:hypothetical protein